MISIEVKDFGPIIEGKVDLKPLTIFVGPNNSGKSYMAMLMYALFRSIPTEESIKRRIPPDQVERDNPNFATRVRENYSRLAQSNYVNLTDLPKDVQEVFQWANQEWGDEFARPFELELGRAYGSELRGLVRSGAESEGFIVRLIQDSPSWSLKFELEINGKVASTENPRIAILPNNESDEPRIGLFLNQETPVQTLYSFFHNFPNTSHYLPTGRASLMSTYKLIASTAVNRLSWWNEDTRGSSHLTGIVSGFIGELLTLDTGRKTKTYEIAAWMEKRISGGTVNLSKIRDNPEIIYKHNGTDYLLHRTSSMVSELAPLILFVKYEIEPSDILFFDEPESHLHPANQRKLAQAIVKMIRKGLKVVITTHSDYFLSQLSNFVRLSELPDERVKRGYDENDYLKAVEVGCYLFDYSEENGGSIIKPLSVDAEDGIDEESFANVAETLYNEMVDLHRARTE